MTVRLSRLRGFVHVLVRRLSFVRRRGHPTHTFVLPPRHLRRGWELAYRELLPTDENIRLSPVLVTPIVLTSCNLPDRHTQQAYASTSKLNPWGTTSSPTPRGMNDDLTSSIYRYPCRIPERLPGPPRSQSCKVAPGDPSPARPLQAHVLLHKFEFDPNSRSCEACGSGPCRPSLALFERSEWRRPIG